MNKMKRIALVLAGLLALAAAVLYGAHLFLLAVWSFPPSPELKWLAGGLYCAAAIGFVAAIILGGRWVQKTPRD